MAIIYKKTLRTNPQDSSDEGKYYPSLITMGKSVNEELIIHQIKELSSLSKGDIQSVMTNFFDVVRTNLYSGHAVNIRNFGIFSLSAKGEGSETEKECTARKITSVHINFRSAGSVRPNINATRAEDKLTFIDFDTYVKNLGISTGQAGNEDDGYEQDPNA